MNIPKACKIELCCADPKMRRDQFAQPFRDGENIIATNGRVLVIVPCFPAPEDADLIRVPIDAIKAARKLPDASIACVGVFRLSSGLTWPKPDNQTALPQYRAAIPGGPATFRALLNVPELVKICAALGSDQVTLEFTGQAGEPKPIRVIPSKGAGTGYMMTGTIAP